MRFQGRIRFDDVRGADLDVSVEVDDTHVRFMSGEESLGSWCLADVVANRVVANVFEIDLSGEVITFLADDQVNFAYGAVQSMAEGWARFHAMNFLRRKGAIAAARRENEPSRLTEARRAFAAAGEQLRAPVIDPGIEHMAEPEPTPVPQATHSPSPSVTAPADLESSEPSTPAPGGFWEKVERATAGQDIQDDEEAAVPEPPTPPRARPSHRVEEVVVEVDAPAVEQEKAPPPPSRLPRLDAFPRRRVPTREDVEATEAEQVLSSDPNHSLAGDEPQVEVEAHVEVESSAPVEPSDGEPAESEPQAEPVVSSEAVTETPPDEDERAPQPRRMRRRVERSETPASPPEVAPEPQPAPEPEPEPERQSVATGAGATDSNGHGERRRQPAAIGAFGDGHHPAETSGLRASMRSIFSRSKGEHEHSFVESTTAVGITRRVCLECGHVSIGVSD